MGDGVSLIDVGKLAKPATVLVEKVAAAIGLLYEPHHVKRMARAEAEAGKIKALAEIEISDIQARALHRLVFEEGRRQENIERITAGAAEQLTESATPETMDDDWIANFFEKCRTVSDHEMQTLWSRLLAGEATKPGSYSKRTVDLVASIEKGEAQLFTQVCSFAVRRDEAIPLVFSFNSEFYERLGINFGALSHLESIGLITLSPLQTLVIRHLDQIVTLDYFGHPVVLKLRQEKENTLAVGRVMLTHSGHQLFPISGATEVPGFLELMVAQFRGSGCEVLSPRAGTADGENPPASPPT